MQKPTGYFCVDTSAVGIVKKHADRVSLFATSAPFVSVLRELPSYICPLVLLGCRQHLQTPGTDLERSSEKTSSRSLQDDARASKERALL
jgi:hypothetical protein